MVNLNYPMEIDSEFISRRSINLKIKGLIIFVDFYFYVCLQLNNVKVFFSHFFSCTLIIAK